MIVEDHSRHAGLGHGLLQAYRHGLPWSSWSSAPRRSAPCPGGEGPVRGKLAEPNAQDHQAACTGRSGSSGRPARPNRRRSLWGGARPPARSAAARAGRSTDPGRSVSWPVSAPRNSSTGAAPQRRMAVEHQRDEPPHHADAILLTTRWTLLGRVERQREHAPVRFPSAAQPRISREAQRSRFPGRPAARRLARP